METTHKGQARNSNMWKGPLIGETLGTASTMLMMAWSGKEMTASVLQSLKRAEEGVT